MGMVDNPAGGEEDDPLAQAELLLELARPEEALDLLTGSAGESVNEADRHRLITLAYLQLGRFHEALDEANRSVQLGPDLELARRLKAMALVQLGRPKDAVDELQEAVRLAPLDPNPVAMLAEVALGTGDLDEAVAAAHHVCALAPDNPNAHALLGRVALARKDLVLARESYQRALALDPSHETARSGLGAANYVSGYKKEAVEEFTLAYLGSGSENARRALKRSIGSYVFGALFFTFLAIRLASISSQEDPSLAAVFAGAIALGAAVLAFRRWRGLPPASRATIRSVWRQDRSRRVWLAWTLFGSGMFMLILGGLSVLDSGVGATSGTAAAMVASFLTVVLSGASVLRKSKKARAGAAKPTDADSP